jgi:peptidoglycan/xylan/chitin deacetylase (PgdA/CDA1 family)
MELSLGILLCAALMAVFFRFTRSSKSIIVAFRYDDFSTLSPSAVEQLMIASFRRIGASITFGVVPCVVERYARNPSAQNLLPLSHDRVILLKEAVRDGVVDLALHGYSHQTHSATDISEFRGLEYGEQLKKIAKGKQFLEEMFESPVNTFIPPWNSYDSETLKAAEALGFSSFSANIKGVAATGSHLQFLPATCGLKRLREAITQARRSEDLQPIIVVLFHPSDFQEVDPRGTTSCQDLSKLLAKLKSQRDIQILSISQASKVINELNTSRFLRNQRIRALSKFLPFRLSFFYSRLYSGSIAALWDLRFRIIIFYLALLGIGLLSFLARN